MTSKPATYPGYRFPAEIISYAVWLYHVFGLSLREVGRVGDWRGGARLGELPLSGGFHHTPVPHTGRAKS